MLGGGCVGGGIVAAALARRLALSAAFLIAMAPTSATLLLLVASPWLWPVFVLMIAGGVGMCVERVACDTLMQRRIPFASWPSRRRA